MPARATETTRMLGIGPAARAAGVSRREIQMRIADGDLASFEGRVDQEALARLYPRAATPPPGMVEYVADVRELARSKAPSAAEPLAEESPEEAMERLAGERDRARALARDRLLLLVDLERRLGQLEVDVEPPQRVRALVQWLRVRLSRGDVR